MKNIKTLIIPALLLSACGSHTSSEHKELPSNPQVKITQVMQTSSVKPLNYSGIVEASQTTPVSFQTIGTVQSVYVDEGMEVKKGDVLATLNDEDQNNLYAISEAQYQQALDAHKRLSEVYKKGSLPEIKWVEIESQLKQAEANRLLAKSNLKKTILRAPLSGFIGRRNIEPGMSLPTMQAPFEIASIDQVQVKISVPETEIPQFTKNLTASISIGALSNQKYIGTVDRIGVVADKLSRTYSVSILLANKTHQIKPGMVCDVNINVPAIKHRTVDYRSVSRDHKGAFVFKVDTISAIASKTYIKTGQVMASGIEIISGLKTGDMVVSEGLEKLSDNTKIVW
ncbi:efflux RND transporter periplasmic adaptor subunit [Geofilum sp. OHC36d9]|uniref:efflux RND transporter periplasmic adaptor subunit n=1 Tax=Geofilum sp. OHC36d9 TaxID=3458413 RepID=UPI0040334554